MRFVGVGDEPADAGSGIVAGSGFAERHFVSAAIEAALAGAIENGGEHTFANFREDLSDIQIALHARREILNVIGGAWRFPICERGTLGGSSRARNPMPRRAIYGL